jgi:hypothetical protein
MDVTKHIVDDRRRDEYLDFARRYDAGAPWDGISEAEAAAHYRDIAPELPRDIYEPSAEDAVRRLDPQQRITLGRYLQERGPEDGIRFPASDLVNPDDRYQDAAYLARVLADLHEERPGVLARILGPDGRTGGAAGPGSLISGPIGRAVLGGIVAGAPRQLAVRT